MKIWRCPNCDDGIRAPAHLRKIDVRRYCLLCSKTTGKLVERTVPSRDAERVRSELLRKEREIKQRERTAAKRSAYWQTERGQLETFARMAMKLEAFEAAQIRTFKIRLAGPTRQYWVSGSRLVDGVAVPFTESRSGVRPATTSGHAYGKTRFVITAGHDRADALATILHEIAHCAAGSHCAAGYKGGAHGDGWRSVFASGVHELTGETPSGKTKTDIHQAAIECVRHWLDRGKVNP